MTHIWRITEAAGETKIYVGLGISTKSTLKFPVRSKRLYSHVKSSSGLQPYHFTIRLCIDVLAHIRGGIELGEVRGTSAQMSDQLIPTRDSNTGRVSMICNVNIKSQGAN